MPILAILTVVACAAALVATVERPGRARAEALGTSRVVATPVPQATPQPPPEPTAAAPVPTPDMGGLRWVPSRDAGPWATDGTVSLPALGVNAPIVRVGVDTKGEMVVPRNARDIAWLDQGGFPGQTNNAVLAGHKNYAGARGSFERIGEMREGDEVLVRFGDRSWTFVVEWVRLYDPNTAPVLEIMGTTAQQSTTLITCGGEFDRRTRHHTKRWVVRAILVSQT